MVSRTGIEPVYRSLRDYLDDQQSSAYGTRHWTRTSILLVNSEASYL